MKDLNIKIEPENFIKITEELCEQAGYIVEKEHLSKSLIDPDENEIKSDKDYELRNKINHLINRQRKLENNQKILIDSISEISNYIEKHDTEDGIFKAKIEAIKYKLYIKGFII